MKNNVKASLIEFGISVIIGVLLFLEELINKPDLAYFVWVLGVMFIFHRILQQKFLKDDLDEIKDLIAIKQKDSISDIKKLLSPITKLSNIRYDNSIDKINSIHELLSKIEEKEFYLIKNNIFLSVKEEIEKFNLFLDTKISKLDNIYVSKKTDKLTEDQFYKWIYRTFDDVKNGGSIQAVSVSNELEWNNSPQEKKFLQVNFDAVKRGVAVERIFITNKENINQLLKNESIKCQLQDGENKINGKFVDKTYLEATNQSLLNKIDCGFIIVNKKVILIDAFDENGEARGYVSLKQDDVIKYIEIYESLRNYSESLESGVLTEQIE